MAAMLSRRTKRNLFFIFSALSGVGIWWLWILAAPSGSNSFKVDYSSYPKPEILERDTSQHQLTILHYRQSGRDIEFLPFSHSANLSPFSGILEKDNQKFFFQKIPATTGTWLRFQPDSLPTGDFSFTLISSQDTTCRVKVLMNYDDTRTGEIADTSRWFRHGSNDDLLDVRVILREGEYYLKDFADYRDGRTRVYFLEGRIITDLSKGIPVRPGYLYSVTARWIDGPYHQWWNAGKYRTSRQQVIWIAPVESGNSHSPATSLTRVSVPEWFTPSRHFNPHFDTLFPEYDAPKNKLVMTYRMNQDVPAENYFKRGVTHLPRWESGAPADRQHWTEAPGFFEDRDQRWFGELPREQVEEYADRVSGIGAYAYDFEFWNRQYAPAVKRGLLWFSKRLRERNPDMFLFDYWGGSAYHNTTFQDKNGIFSPASFLEDYRSPQSNNINFNYNPGEDFFGNYFNVNIIDVYPRPPVLTGNGSLNLNNYLLLSAIHATRINRLFEFQKNNKTLWFAWDRFMPLYKDPAFFWDCQTTRPAGILSFAGMETIPASQALSLSLFSLIEGDGFYLWNDSQPYGRGENNYRVSEESISNGAVNWKAADGSSPADAFSTTPDRSESPRYWNYPSDYFALGVYLTKSIESVLTGGRKEDLPFFTEGKWHFPKREQAVIAATHQLPFVTSVTKGSEIIILAVDSFQLPHSSKQLKIRLPNGTETEIELYGNWPSLYRGKLK